MTHHTAHHGRVLQSVWLSLWLLSLLLRLLSLLLLLLLALLDQHGSLLLAIHVEALEYGALDPLGLLVMALNSLPLFRTQLGGQLGFQVNNTLLQQAQELGRVAAIGTLFAYPVWRTGRALLPRHVRHATRLLLLLLLLLLGLLWLWTLLRRRGTRELLVLLLWSLIGLLRLLLRILLQESLLPHVRGARWAVGTHML